MEKNTITRKEIYDLVWKEALTTISKRLNIPYTHLRKVCSALNVPIPPNGHWARIHLGRSVEILALPKDYDGVNEINLHPEGENVYNPKILTFYKKSAADLIREDKSLHLKVPNALSNPDELIVTAQKQLQEYRYNKYNDYGMVRAEGAINIRVSRHNIGRALRIMDTLIKLLKARGHNLSVQFSHLLEIDGESYQLKLMEKTEEISAESKWNRTKRISTGLLYFNIDGYMGRTWTDGTLLIEERLPEILAKLESIIYWWKEERRFQEKHQKKLEEKERIIRGRQERIEKEKAAFKDLYKQAKRWERARFILEYIKAVEENAVEKGILTDEVQVWLKWAQDKAEWYDPLMNREDVILGLFKRRRLY